MRKSPAAGVAMEGKRTAVRVAVPFERGRLAPTPFADGSAPSPDFFAVDDAAWGGAMLVPAAAAVTEAGNTGRGFTCCCCC